MALRARAARWDGFQSSQHGLRSGWPCVRLLVGIVIGLCCWSLGFTGPTMRAKGGEKEPWLWPRRPLRLESELEGRALGPRCLALGPGGWPLGTLGVLSPCALRLGRGGHQGRLASAQEPKAQRGRSGGRRARGGERGLWACGARVGGAG